LFSRPGIAHRLGPDGRSMLEKLEVVLATCTGNDPTSNLSTIGLVPSNDRSRSHKIEDSQWR
jgi:hypothetical protein